MSYGTFVKLKEEAERYQELDALRGIAALIVVFFHLTMWRPEAQLGFKYGVTGVDLFFIISGFVIFMTLSKTSSAKEFIINRVSRLYPVYWTCVTFTFGLSLIVLAMGLVNPQEVNGLKYLYNLTMFQYYFRVENIDGPYWSMIIEMVFYGLVLLVFCSEACGYCT